MKNTFLYLAVCSIYKKNVNYAMILLETRYCKYYGILHVNKKIIQNIWKNCWRWKTKELKNKYFFLKYHTRKNPNPNENSQHPTNLFSLVNVSRGMVIKSRELPQDYNFLQFYSFEWNWVKITGKCVSLCQPFWHFSIKSFRNCRN